VPQRRHPRSRQIPTRRSLRKTRQIIRARFSRRIFARREKTFALTIFGLWRPLRQTRRPLRLPLGRTFARSSWQGPWGCRSTRTFAKSARSGAAAAGRRRRLPSRTARCGTSAADRCRARFDLSVFSLRAIRPSVHHTDASPPRLSLRTRPRTGLHGRLDRPRIGRDPGSHRWWHWPAELTS